MHVVRDLDEKRPSKKRFKYLLGHLSIWVSGVESPLIFLYKKKNTNYKIYDWKVPFIDWIKITYLEKLENYIVLGPSYNLPNNYMAYCPSYILPKMNEDKARSTKPKT